MLKKLLMLLVLVLQYNSAQAFNYGKFISCNSINPTPKIIFKVSYGKLNYIFDKNTDQLSEMLTDENHKNGTYRAAGLAPSTFYWRVIFKKGHTKYIAKDVYCVYPEEIEVVVGLKDPTIYVSSNYQPGDFWYALTLRHEQVHQWINKLTLEYFLPLFYERIIATARQVRAVKVNSGTQEAIDAGYKKVYDYYLARLKPVVEEFRKVQKEEQHKLDNKMNYAAEAELFRQYEAKQKLMNQKFD